MAETMTCPKCKAPLEAHEVSPGVTAFHCPACFGVMHESENLTVPLNLSGAAPARFDCPRCRRPMETATAFDGKLEVDRCAKCAALWFDAGEFQILRKLAGREDVAGKPAPEKEPKAAGKNPKEPAKSSDEPMKAPVPPPTIPSFRRMSCSAACNVSLRGQTLTR